MGGEIRSSTSICERVEGRLVNLKVSDPRVPTTWGIAPYGLPSSCMTGHRRHSRSSGVGTADRKPASRLPIDPRLLPVAMQFGEPHANRVRVTQSKKRDILERQSRC